MQAKRRHHCERLEKKKIRVLQEAEMAMAKIVVRAPRARLQVMGLDAT